MKESTPKDTPVTAVTDPEEADTTSTETEEAELFSRGGSVPLAVEDAEEEVQEVEAPAKTVEEFKITFHRTPNGVGASKENLWQV